MIRIQATQENNKNTHRPKVGDITEGRDSTELVISPVIARSGDSTVISREPKTFNQAVTAALPEAGRGAPSVLVRLSPDEVEKLDDMRGQVSRANMLRILLMEKSHA